MINMRVKDLKAILENIPDETLIVIPVVNEDNVNDISGFRLVRTAGILEDDYEDESMRRVLCLNGSADGYDIADQVFESGRDVSVIDILYGKSVFEEKKGEQHEQS